MSAPSSPRRLWRGLREVFVALPRMLVRYLPGPLGTRLRRLYWGRRLGSMWERVRIDEAVTIANPEYVFIGSDCWIAAEVSIGGGPVSTVDRQVVRRSNDEFRGRSGEVHIGDHVYIAKGAAINGHAGVELRENCSVSTSGLVLSASHYYRGPDDPAGVPSVASGTRRTATDQVGPQAVILGPVVLLEESFVGAHAIVLPGSTMGPATWLGAGAVGAGVLEPHRLYRSPDPIAVEIPAESPAAGRARAS